MDGLSYVWAEKYTEENSPLCAEAEVWDRGPQRCHALCSEKGSSSSAVQLVWLRNDCV